MAIEMIGRTFGRLTVLDRAESRSGKPWFGCVCSCGTRGTYSGAELRRGNVKSCGCLQRQLAVELFSINLSGQRFGRLVVVERVGSRRTYTEWLCICDCGEKHLAVSADLRSGHINSCGCYRSESISARFSAARAMNPAIGRLYQKRLRESHTLAGLPREYPDKDLVFERDGGMCHICLIGADPNDWHLDHIVPVSRGGLDRYDNVAVSHPFCNLSKGDKMMHELSVDE